MGVSNPGNVLLLHIAIDPWVFDNEKTFSLCSRLHIDTVRAVGHLVSLWAWTAEHRPDGFIPDEGKLSILDDKIRRAARWQGEGDIVAELLGSGFIDRVEGGVQIHHWMDFSGTYNAMEYYKDLQRFHDYAEYVDRVRKQNVVRQQRYRKRKSHNVNENQGANTL